MQPIIGQTNNRDILTILFLFALCSEQNPLPQQIDYNANNDGRMENVEDSVLR